MNNKGPRNKICTILRPNIKCVQWVRRNYFEGVVFLSREKEDDSVLGAMKDQGGLNYVYKGYATYS